MHPVSPVNHVFVKMQAYDDTVKTESGVTLFKDTTFNPEWSATLSAEALSVPIKVGQIDGDTEGVLPFVQKGDQILFRYIVVQQLEQRDNDTPIHHNQHLIDGEIYWKVNYSMILGVVRNGELIPAPGYVFAKPVVNMLEERKGILYLPDSVRKQEQKDRAVVVCSGVPKKDRADLELRKDDVIVYRPGMAEKYELNGEQYLVIRQEYIAAKEV
ncbi:co-chaperone GroES family protein [Lacibacter sp. MH-610]|uniref:co-chaperone GroES family protein n=1 Tax=Lacibacter sp. MH-610 TaxID=3020883 RepID=UPI003891BF64